MRRTLTFPVKWEKGASVLCPRLFLPVLEQRRDQQWPMNSVNDTSPCPPSAHSSNLHAGKGTKSEKEDSVPSPCHVLFPLPLLGLGEGIPGVWGSTLFSFLTPQQIPACTSAVGLLCYTLMLLCLRIPELPRKYRCVLIINRKVEELGVGLTFKPQ